MDITKLRERHAAAQEELETRSKEWDDLDDDAPTSEVDQARTALNDALEAAEDAERRVKDAEAVEERKASYKPAPIDDQEKRELERVKVGAEPDMYEGRERRFLDDLFRSQILHDPLAVERISRHQQYELEKRAVSTSTLGGIIPPQYLVDMYAKASRYGRVFADQVNHQELPEVGMSLIVPRLTQGTAADIQASEGVAVATQDPTETDLTVPVRTIAGYIPVSRQTLERASYSEAILFEDLIARYWSKLDSQCLVGTGSAGQLLGLFNTTGVVSVSAGATFDAPTFWKNVQNAIQQIETKWGGLGIKADKIVMHPRRWAAISALMDSDNRPLFGFNNLPVVQTAVVATGSSNTYGFVGYFAGLPVFTDSNIPTNLDTNGDKDGVAVISSPIVHLWERPDDPVTLAFEQQAGTALQVQLIAYGYVAYTAGRYPDASAVIHDLPVPTF